MIKYCSILFTVASLWLTAVSARADAQGVVVKIADLPTEVKQTIRAQVGKGRLGEIEKITDGADITYDVEMRKGGKMRNFTVSEEGILLDKEVFLGETPAPVQTAIRQRAGTNEIQGITKVFEGGGISYEVEVGDEEHPRTFTLGENGRLVEMEVSLAETPAPVQQAIQKESAGGKIGDITETFEDGNISYEVQLNPDGKSRNIAVDPKGNIVSEAEDVALSATPDAVQKTVNDLVKGGHLSSLTKTTEDGDVTYDVELRRGEKWESVSIDPDGKVEQ